MKIEEYLILEWEAWEKNEFEKLIYLHILTEMNNLFWEKKIFFKNSLNFKFYFISKLYNQFIILFSSNFWYSLLYIHRQYIYIYINKQTIIIVSR